MVRGVSMNSRIVQLKEKQGLRGITARKWRDMKTSAYGKEWVRRIVSTVYSRNLTQPEKWLFLVGCYNSGTTIIQNLISQHPDVASMPREGAIFTNILQQPEDLGWSKMWLKCPDYMQMGNMVEPQKKEKIWQDWLPWWSRSASVFMEHSATNVTRMEWLNKNFPNAYFIGITRDGYCVSEDIKREARPALRNQKFLGSKNYDLSLTAQQWVLANQQLLEGKNKVQRYMQIQYEEIIKHPDVVLDRIFSFLGLKPIDLMFSNNQLLISGKNFDIKNMNSESLANMSDQDLRQISPIIYEMQVQLGYPIKKLYAQQLKYGA